jgi:pimeloyl-ACP methyl ester carboxylesterase
MPAVFVHGVPDTSSLWGPVIDRLARDDVVTVQLPGFGAAVPAGFGATKDEYVAFVAAEIEAAGAPVDLVGHDWGSLLTQRVATTRPDLVRTWTSSGGAIHPRFKWHDLAQQWQTPDVGEQIMAAMTPDLVEPVMADAGHPDPAGCAAHVDGVMKQSILALYRSAVDIVAEWNPPAPSGRPALFLWGTEDPYSSVDYGRAAAEQEGATFTVLDGAGHWAIVERPDASARALEVHWASA